MTDTNPAWSQRNCLKTSKTGLSGGTNPGKEQKHFCRGQEGGKNLMATLSELQRSSVETGEPSRENNAPCSNPPIRVARGEDECSKGQSHAGQT